MKPIVLILAAALAGAPAQAQPLSRDELIAALKARDQLIADLQQRVTALERERAAPSPSSAPPPITLPPGPQAAAAAATAVSEDDEALQALSRTLVQRGGLLLPAWRMELIPSIAYSTRLVQGLALAPTPEGIPTVADQRLRNDQARASAAFRIGLPWSSQFEAQIPYGWARQSRALGDGSHAVNHGSGWGDVDLALSHQLLREAAGRPDLIAGLSWRIASGRSPFRTRVGAVAPGSGADELRARLTAVKSSDPVVFFGTLAYAHPFATHEFFGQVQFGDAIALDLGAVLALNPQTSFTAGLSQEFRGRTQIDHLGTPGSDTLAASLQLGVDRVLTPNILLDVSLGVGLTRDAPDYALQISLPIRFR